MDSEGSIVTLLYHTSWTYTAHPVRFLNLLNLVNLLNLFVLENRAVMQRGLQNFCRIFNYRMNDKYQQESYSGQERQEQYEMKQEGR